METPGREHRFLRSLPASEVVGVSDLTPILETSCDQAEAVDRRSRASESLERRASLRELNTVLDSGVARCSSNAAFSG